MTLDLYLKYKKVGLKAANYLAKILNHPHSNAMKKVGITALETFALMPATYVVSISPKY